MSRAFSLLFSLALLLVFPIPSEAITPIAEYFDLVAGEGQAGFRDGVFTSAMFNRPCGAAFSADGHTLFISDRDNHRIRALDLEHKNQVTTLAGTGTSGKKDGPFASATFDLPGCMVSLPGGRLVVFDAGNHCLRMLDLSKREVTTLLDLDQVEPSDPPAWVAAMTWDPSDGSILFTQPTIGTLKKLGMKDRQVRVLLAHDPKVPNPYALCLFQGRLCLTDQNPGPILRVEPGPNTSSAYTVGNFAENSQGERVVSLVPSGDILYAFQNAAVPWVRITPGDGLPTGEVKFMSLWGNFPATGSEDLIQLLRFPFLDSPDAFLPFPGDARRFLWVSPYLNTVFSLRDYGFYENKDSAVAQWIGTNPDGLTDFSYPKAKPPKTFRILLLGDSRTFYMAEGEENKRWPWGFHRMDTFPKKLEAMLNFEASLTDSPVHFQVLTYARYRWAGPLHLWPFFCGVEPAEKFDVDAVFLFMVNEMDLEPWFVRPYQKDGIPDLTVDDKEYMLKPMKEKLADKPLARDLYERCLARQWVEPDKWAFKDGQTLASDPKVREDLVGLATLSLGLYRKSLAAIEKKEGHVVPLRMLFAPVGSVAAPFPIEAYRELYGEVCKRTGIGFEDLTDPWTALKISAYPTMDHSPNGHYTFNGHTLMAYMVARYLLQHHLVPMGASK